jgi:hypothetical protein
LLTLAFAVLSVVYSVTAQVQPSSESVPSSSLVSSRAQALISHVWTSSSFANGIAVLTNRNETKESRALVMEVLDVNRNKLAAQEMEQFVNETTTIAKNNNEDEVLSALAIRTIGNVTLTMKELGQINENESKKERAFLVEAATNSERSSSIQASAINTLGLLQIAESSPLLHRILENSTTMNLAEISRPACLSLMRIDGERAIPTLRRVLRNTTDSRVFGTAAFALGQIKKRDSLIALIENQERFEGTGSCGAVLVDMEGVILGLLNNPNDPNLEPAIRATRHLWREGQRERYVPLLESLITTAPMPMRKVAMERLFNVAGQMDLNAEKKLLADVQPAVISQPELAEYAQRIKNRLSAVLLAPSGGLQPMPAARKGGN